MVKKKRMASTAFDALACFENLKAAGVTEEQARLQANAFRDFASSQIEANQNNLAAKGDLREMELRLQKEIGQSKYSLLQWLTGLLLAQSAFLAALFAWLKQGACTRDYGG